MDRDLSRKTPGRPKKLMPDNFGEYYYKIMTEPNVSKTAICEELGININMLNIFLAEFHIQELEEYIQALKALNKDLEEQNEILRQEVIKLQIQSKK